MSEEQTKCEPKNEGSDANGREADTEHSGRSVDQGSDRTVNEGLVDEESSTSTSQSDNASATSEQEVVIGRKVDPNDALNCNDEINDIHKVINKQEAEFDKQLLTLCSALIALSLAFAKDVAPLPPGFVPLLITGLILLVCCIVSVLLSIQISIQGQEKAKDYWTLRRGDTWGTHPFPMWYARSIKIANAVSCLLFVSGLVSVGTFVLVNVKKEIKVADNNTDRPKHILANDGASIKIPIPPNGDKNAGATIKTKPTPPPSKK